MSETGDSSINSVGVKSYAIAGDTQAQDWETGIGAELATIGQPNMAAIQSSLQSGDPSTLPSALASDPWGTNPSTVAQILGESASQISALGAAGSGSGGATATLTGAFGVPGLPSFLDPTNDIESFVADLWGDIEPFVARSFLVIAGLGLMVLGVYKLTDAGPKIKNVLSSAGPAVEAAAAA